MSKREPSVMCFDCRRRLRGAAARYYVGRNIPPDTMRDGSYAKARLRDAARFGVKETPQVPSTPEAFARIAAGHRIEGGELCVWLIEDRDELCPTCEGPLIRNDVLLSYTCPTCKGAAWKSP